MSKPRKYWIRLTADMPNGSSYTAQRMVSREEVDLMQASDKMVLKLHFDRAIDMLVAGFDWDLD